MRVREIHPQFRGKGFTTRQMINAPEGAVYVWPTYSLTYPRMLARQLKRQDLLIYSPSILGEGGLWLRGYRRALILDHACEPDHDEYQVIIDYEEWYEQNKN